jgi:glucokinase
MEISLPHIIGIEIGGTKLQVVLGLADGSILERRRGTVNREAGAQGILEWTSKEVSRFLDASQSSRDVAALGIGFGGPVESETGRALVSHQIAGWENVPIKYWFEEKFRLPVVVANDANAAGWAEYCLGVGRGNRQFMYMNIGSGIGGALVIDGKLYDGQGRGACEIGHTWVPDWTSAVPGAVDKLENLCSGWAIERRLHNLEHIKPGSPLHTLCGGRPENLTCPILAEAAREKDSAAICEITHVAQSIGIALGNAVTLFHPQIIALGGGVSLMGDVFLNPLREALILRCFGPYRDTIHLVPCTLKEDVVAVGALLLAGKLAH